MWVADPINNPGAPFNAQQNWTNAIINCEALNFAGHSDWRLPNVKELFSLPDFGSNRPAIDVAMFPNTTWNGVMYWSATTSDINSLYARWVKFEFGGSGASTKVSLLWVRPVRLGLPA